MAEKRPDEEEMDHKALPQQQTTLLPKPVRLFSYIFFGAVLVTGILGWFLNQH